MELLNLNLETITYIQSEAEFNQARKTGFWDVLISLLKGRRTRPLAFDQVVEKLHLEQSNYLGLEDISLEKITGSAGRDQDFTFNFWPWTADVAGKERWRSLYIRAVTGAGFPPIDLYKVGQLYFVKDGHHRVSVARYLNWETIQAHVTELPTSKSRSAVVRCTHAFRCNHSI